MTLPGNSLRRRLLRSITVWPVIAIVAVAFTVAGLQWLAGGDDNNNSAEACEVLIALDDAFTNGGPRDRACLTVSDVIRLDLYGADLSGASLARVNLMGKDLRGARLQGALLEDARLDNARLDRAHLEGALLSGTSFRGACLRRANLRGADLRDADFTGADISGVRTAGALGLSSEESPVGWGTPVKAPAPCNRDPS